ncbi:MAG TPA: RdgB/HAM1 family non-canonical purine NTP pyrophosphatase [Gammaproteobacteria bacterium]|nr:RdgB/HAM1 family non-canonical purine NTP pyrophosphatase [Gammaproteobacteria bacterium]
MTERWVIATGNSGKLAELRSLLAEADLGTFELVAQTELGVPPVDEPAVTFLENALIKARHAARHTGLPAIADDSGLAVAALGGAPGVRSARFAGPGADDRANVAKLLEDLADVPPGRRAARFHCVLVALEREDDPAPVVASGTWDGEIALRPSGGAGFGYDPVFLDPRLGKTAAELPATVKNEISHRGQALRRLVAGLKARRPDRRSSPSD